MTTSKILSAFFKDAMKTRYFTGAFQAPPENFYNTEDVEIDIMRSGEDIAVAVQSLSADARYNSDDAYTNKKFRAPIFKEAFALNAFDLLARQPGMSINDDPDFQGAATAKSLRLARKLQDKITRSIELQAAQILTTGTVTLTDGTNTIYTIDFKPKATHFPTATVDWTTTATADPIADLEALADVIRADGLAQPDILEMGAGAFESAMLVASFKDRFETRRADLGALTPPEARGDGGQHRGYVVVGNYRFDVFTVPEWYAAPGTGTATRYLTDDLVIMRTSGARLDATFGAIPRIAPPEARALPYLPPRLSSSAERIDLWTNAWLSLNGEQLFVSVASRPLLIPTDIDSFGCLNTVA